MTIDTVQFRDRQDRHQSSSASLCLFCQHPKSKPLSLLSDLSKQLKWSLFVPSHLTCQTEKWKEPRVLELCAVMPPVTSPTERKARYRNDGAVQILNMFWHKIKSCSPLWGRDSPFSVWSLIRPLGERGRNTDTWIFSLHFLWLFFRQIWESFHIVRYHFIVRLKLWSLHIWGSWKATYDQWGFLCVAGFYLPHILPSGVHSWVCCCYITDWRRTFDGFAVVAPMANVGQFLKIHWTGIIRIFRAFERWLAWWIWSSKNTDLTSTYQPTNPISQNSCHLTSFCQMTMALRGE